MVSCKREISKEVYDRAKANRGYIVQDDRKDVFSISELCGHGVYGDTVIKEDDKYFVVYTRGSSCD